MSLSKMFIEGKLKREVVFWRHNLDKNSKRRLKALIHIKEEPEPIPKPLVIPKPLPVPDIVKILPEVQLASVLEHCVITKPPEQVMSSQSAKVQDKKEIQPQPVAVVVTVPVSKVPEPIIEEKKEARPVVIPPLVLPKIEIPVLVEPTIVTPRPVATPKGILTLMNLFTPSSTLSTSTPPKKDDCKVKEERLVDDALLEPLPDDWEDDMVIIDGWVDSLLACAERPISALSGDKLRIKVKG